MMDINQFEKTANINFKDKRLLTQAFTHRSYLNENKGAGPDNERLEFLGDAVLQLVVTDFLFKKYPKMSEGELTSLRSALVNAPTCALVADKLGVNDYLLLSKGEAKDSGRARQFILANTLEAIIGALYMDQGYEASSNFIYAHVIPLSDEIVRGGTWIDSKSLFQAKAQEHEGFTPVYKLLSETGPDHDKTFKVGVFIRDGKLGEGEGASKQDAEQAAARAALQTKGWN